MASSTTTSNTIPYDNVHTVNYFTKGIDQQGPYYDVEYYTSDYANSDAFVNFLLGRRSLSGKDVSSITPHRYPLAPNCWCCEASVVDGLGGPLLNANGYPYFKGGALIRAKYRVPKFQFEENQNESNQQIDPGTPILWATQEIDLVREVYSVPSTYLQFANGNPTNQPFRLYVPLSNMVITYHQVPFLPMTLFYNATQNPVNSKTFLGVGAGLALFAGASTTREWTSDGTVAQKVRVTYSARCANQPWNSLPDPANGLKWSPVSAGGQKPYGTSDLNQTLILG